MSHEVRIEVDARGFDGFVYKGAAGLIEALFEREPQAAAEAAHARLLWLAPIAPSVRTRVGVPPEVERALAVSREGKRRDWSLRTAHGLVDFVLEALAGQLGRIQIVVRDVGDEPLDAEFFRTLRGRADPGRVAIELLPAAEPAPPPADHDIATLAAHARRCMDLACYEAALQWAALAEAALGGGRHPLRPRIIHAKLFALLLLERLEAVEALCAALLEGEEDPAIRVDAGYARAILHARFHARARRDYRAARSCIEAALAAAEDMPLGDARAVNTAFLHNTLALVELREGRADAAEGLLTRAIADLSREAPARFAEEATILFRNRARVHLSERRPAAALADLQRLHELEPSHPEAWFDRALIHQDAGRHEEALAAYDQAIRWAPPQVETLHNRAHCLRALGRPREAWDACGRVLEIDPDHVATLVDRACLSQALGELGAMARDVEHGLACAPNEARLLCLRGVLAVLEGRNEAALAALDAALDRAPDLADAWANRAIVRVRRGEMEAALSDMDRALALRDDPVIRRNRQRILDRVRMPAPAP